MISMKRATYRKMGSRPVVTALHEIDQAKCLMLKD